MPVTIPSRSRSHGSRFQLNPSAQGGALGQCLADAVGQCRPLDQLEDERSFIVWWRQHVDLSDMEWSCQARSLALMAVEEGIDEHTDSLAW